MSMDPLLQLILPYVLLMARVSSFLIVLPIFGWRSIPVRVKVATTILMAFFFSMVMPVTIENCISNATVNIKKGAIQIV